MSADFWAGYLSGAAGILLGNPLDLVKVRLQAGAAPSLFPASSPSSTSSSLPTASPLRRSASAALAAVATGTAAPILGYGALNALLFVSYRQAEQLLSPSSSPSSPPSPTTTWIAGALAGLATWIVSTPTELVKCRAQLAGASSSSTTPQRNTSSWSIARHVYRTEGVRGFFLGGTVTALRDSIGYGFYFWSYLLATDAWRRRSSSSADGDDTSIGAVGTLLCGGLAGIVTWASVFPLDVIKTRVQAQDGGLAAAAAAAPLLGSSPSNPPRQSTLAITRQAYRTEGLGVFFRGLGVCSARAFFVNAVQWAVYEWAMRELGAGGVRNEMEQT